MKKFMIICLPILLFYGILSAQGSGSAINYHGSANCGCNSTLRFTSSFTIEAWIYPTTADLSGEHSIIDRRSSYGGYQLRLGSGNVRFCVRASNGTEHAVSTSGLVADKWQHIAGVLVSSSNKVLTIYINGVSKISTDTGTYTLGSETTEFYIGKSKLGSNYYLNGSIDEVRAWSRALTGEEIQNIMCLKLLGSNSNLEGYWRLDEGSGNTFADDSPNSNTGTGVNGNWITSGVPLGDASTCDYSTPSSVTLASGYGGDVTVGTIANSPDGVQIYRVDSEPNVTTPPAGLDQLSQSHYFGVFVVGGSSPTYTLTYNYDGHPGISNENNLELAYRSNNAATSWTDLDAALETGANTLTKSGQTGTEYILASTGGNSLPVILSTFTVQYLNNIPTLY